MNPNSNKPTPPANRPLPIQNFQLSKKDLEDPSLGRLNVMLQQVIQAVNAHAGVAGPTVLPSGVDVKGATVTGLAAPSSPSDAISSGHADGKYSAPTLAPQLDIGGSNALKGLTALQGTISKGVTGTVSLAKITSGGSNGSLTFSSGVITAYTPPT